MSLDIFLLLYLFILARYYRPIKKIYQQAEHFKIVDSIFIRENAGQGKSAFQHFLHSSIYDYFNPFSTNVALLDVFRGYISGTLVENGLNTFYTCCSCLFYEYWTYFASFIKIFYLLINFLLMKYNNYNTYSIVNGL